MEDTNEIKARVMNVLDLNMFCLCFNTDLLHWIHTVSWSTSKAPIKSIEWETFQPKLANTFDRTTKAFIDTAI